MRAWSVSTEAALSPKVAHIGNGRVSSNTLAKARAADSRRCEVRHFIFCLFHHFSLQARLARANLRDFRPTNQRSYKLHLRSIVAHHWRAGETGSMQTLSLTSLRTLE